MWKRAIQLWVKADAEGFPSAPPQPTAIQREAVREYFVKKQRDEEEERKQKEYKSVEEEPLEGSPDDLGSLDGTHLHLRLVLPK